MKRALLCLILCAGCLQTVEDTPTSNFETLWSDFDAHYGLFPVKSDDIDWDAQYETYRPMVTDETNDAELSAIFKEMLTPLNDGHVFLLDWSSREPWSAYDAGREEDDFDFAVVEEHYLTGVGGVDGDLSWGHLAPSVGYLRPHHFAFSGAPAKVAAAVDALSDTSTLVIDARSNPGGTDSVSAAIAACFAETPTPFMEVRLRNGPAHTDFTEPILWDLVPDDRCAYDGEVILITNAFAFSAAEVFSMAMVQLPGVTHIGEHTAGSFSDVVTRELPNGWVYSLSVGDWRDAQGVNHEGIGIVPTVDIVNPGDALAEGRDEVLDLALEMAVSADL